MHGSAWRGLGIAHKEPRKVRATSHPLVARGVFGHSRGMAKSGFNPRGAAVVARDFRFDGREYKTGEPFAWRKLGRNPDGKPCKLDEVQLRGLWLADMIDFPDRVDKNGRAIAAPVE